MEAFESMFWLASHLGQRLCQPTSPCEPDRRVSERLVGKKQALLERSHRLLLSHHTFWLPASIVS